MKLSLIAAMAKNRVIGCDNEMPWHLPADLKHFKSKTLNKPVVMGRKTFLSLGSPLPHRRNIVLSRQPNWSEDGVEVFHDLDEVLTKLADEVEVMVIGGQSIYELALARANYLYLTLIDLTVAGDTYFPKWNENEWRECARAYHAADEKNPAACWFVELQRVC